MKNRLPLDKSNIFEINLLEHINFKGNMPHVPTHRSHRCHTNCQQNPTMNHAWGMKICIPRIGDDTFNERGILPRSP